MSLLPSESCRLGFVQALLSANLWRLLRFESCAEVICCGGTELIIKHPEGLDLGLTRSVASSEQYCTRRPHLRLRSVPTSKRMRSLWTSGSARILSFRQAYPRHWATIAWVVVAEDEARACLRFSGFGA